MELSVSIVIPALNEEQHIGRCLHSLMNLDYPKEDLKICIVDNYSSDATTSIASTFAVNILRVPVRTIGFSRNAGSLNADTDIIAFLDADCMVSPGWLKEAMKHFVFADTVAVGSYPRVLDAESNNLQKTWSKLCSKATGGIHEVEWLPSANLIVRASTFRLVGGFNESLVTCEDVDLSYKLKYYGKLIYDPGVTVYHLREPKNFKEFFKKEVWHTRSNFAGMMSHGFRLSEIPSLIAPVLFGLGLAVGLLAIVVPNTYSWAGISISLFILLIYALKGYLQTGSIIMVLAIYCVYFLARAYSVLLQLIRSARRRLFCLKS